VAKTGITINQKKHSLENTTVTADELRKLAKAGADYEVWKVVKKADPEGKLPADDLLIKGEVKVKSGDKFRVVPPGTFGRPS